MSAFDENMRQDMRRLRIQPLLHEILQIVGKHLSDDDHRRNAMRELHNELFDKLYEQGAEIVNDYTRAAMGLPPRGPDGWTHDELVALERQRIEAITRPLRMTVPKDFEFVSLRSEIPTPIEPTPGK